MPKSRVKAKDLIKKTVAASATVTIDTVALAKFKGLRYFVSGSGGTKTKVLDLTVRNINGVGVEDSIFGRVGDLPMQIGAILSGSDIILQATNPNLFDIDIEVCKFTLGR